MIQWADAREPLASWAEAAAKALPAPGPLQPVGSLDRIGLDDGRSVLVAGETGGWIVCDERSRSAIDTLWGCLEDPGADPLVEVLWRRGLASLGGVGVFDDIDVAAAIEASRQRYTMVLLLNTGCNLTCDYCYLGHRQPTADVTMPIETALAAVDAALQQPWDEVMFDFGEIAVSGRRFEEVARTAALRAERGGKRARVAVQTNATMIDGPTADLLAELDAVVGISLDGPRHLHDASRTFRSGTGSYDRVVKALGLLAERSVAVHLIATIGRHNVANPIDVVGELVGHQPTSFLLKPVLAEGEAATAWGRQGVHGDEYAAFMAAVIDHAVREGPQYLDQTATKFVGRMLGDYNGWRDSCTSRSCGSGRSLHVIDPFGRTHACPRFVEEPAGGGPVSVTFKPTRSSPPPIASPFLGDLLPGSLREPPADCSGCPWLSSCGGGCTLVGHDKSEPSIPQPDPHCSAYDVIHHRIATSVFPWLLDGRFAEAPVFNGAKVRQLQEVGR